MNAVVDFPVKPEARDYLARFARDADEPGWLAARRQQAMTRFAELGFPNRKSENWRYLDLQTLERRPLLPAHPSSPAHGESLRDRLSPLLLSEDGPRFVLVDGRFVPALSKLGVGDGLWFGSVRQAVKERPDLLRGVLEDEA